MKDEALELISVIITTHKGADTIVRAVDSVLTQDYPKIEVIVVDDNGEGNKEQKKTQEALKTYIDEGKVVYIAHKQNRNGSAARNTGIRFSHGTYIGLLDDDDVYLDGKISCSIERLNTLDDDWGGVYTDVAIDYGSRGKYINRYRKEGNITFDLLAHTIFINPSVLILRKKAVLDIEGFDESFKRHQDWEFNARFADRYKIAHVGIIGSIYNCQVKRHYDPNAALEYRTYYLEKMRPIISRLSRARQEVVYYRNAIGIYGFRFSNFKKCNELVILWGASVSFISFCRAMYLTTIERIKVKANKA